MENSKENVAVVFGDWSRNIGNAFFQLGAEWILTQIFPKAQITIISDQPGYPSYWNPKGGNPENYLDMTALIEPDYLCLVGPVFRPEIEKIWSKTMENIYGKTKLILIGVAAMDYQSQNIKIYRDFLRRFPPFVLASRDSETFEQLGDLAEHAYDGIDLGFFLPEVYQPASSNLGAPFIALNFDKLPEPAIYLGGQSESTFEMKHPLDQTFEFGGRQWSVRFPPLRTNLALQSRYAMFLEGTLFRGSLITRLEGLNVVRTDHRPHPMIPRKTYRYPNMLVNDTPYPFIEIYSKAELVLSNRMHACVVATAYGRPSMLFSESPRIRLLERVGLNEIRKRPMTIDQDYLSEERSKLKDFLQRTLKLHLQ